MTTQQPSNQSSSANQQQGGTRLGTALMASLCTLLGVNLMVMAFGHFAGPSQAHAQVSGFTNGGLPAGTPPSGITPAPENIPSAPTTAVDMLKRVVEQQIEMNARLARIEGQMRDTYNVNVNNWPANVAGK